MKIRDAYDAWAGGYDGQENKTRDLDKEITSGVLAGRWFRNILELGCGTGKNTPFYAEIAGSVTAFDFSAAMLDRAREIAGLTNVTFRQVDLRALWPVEDDSMDLVACNLVLEHIEDLGHVFSEAARVLEPGGTFFICEFHPFRQYLGNKATMKTVAVEREIPAFVHHISDFLDAAMASGFTLERFNEWRHAEDEDKPPRLATFLFKKREKGKAKVGRKALLR